MNLDLKPIQSLKDTKNLHKFIQGVKYEKDGSYYQAF